MVNQLQGQKDENVNNVIMSRELSHQHKYVLRSGDVTLLNTEAVTNSTNESLSDKSPMSERMLSKAGPDLRRELKTNIKGT